MVDGMNIKNTLTRPLVNGGLVFACVATLAGPTVAMAGDGTFPGEPADSPFAAGRFPSSLAVGDFNSDGRQDLVVADYGGYGSTVRLGAGDGSFPTASSPAAGAGPKSVVVDDFNSDGHEDLAVANIADGDVTINLGAGDGTFSAPASFPVGVNPVSLAAGDFNTDGKSDLVAVLAGGAVAVILGQGDGTFQAKMLTLLEASTDSVAVGDFDNDGRQDLAVAGSHGAYLLRGAGNGTFPTQFLGSPLGSGSIAASVAVGDFNSDGLEDLALSNYGVNAIGIHLGAGKGSFPNSAASVVPTVTDPRELVVGDFNSDGNDDLAVTSDVASGGVGVHLGAGNGRFPTQPAGSPVPSPGTPIGLAVGDFDGDGNEDLAIVNNPGDSVTVRLGGGSPPLAANLLTNGGFEGSGALQLFGSTPVPTPGWQTTGNMTFANYGLPTNTYSPDRLDAARIGGGENYLYPGFGADATASQTVDISGAATSIDAGLAAATLSAYLGGGNIFNDRMSAAAVFLDASGAVLDSFRIGPVTNVQRNNLTGLLRRSATHPVPAGTRQINVTLTARDDDANYSGASADNVKLTLAAPAPPDTVVPDTTAPDTTAPETTKGKGARKRSSHHTARFSFSSEPDATFMCQLDKRPFAPCSSPAKVRRLRLGEHVFQVEAVDASGNVDPSPARWKFRVVRPR